MTEHPDKRPGSGSSRPKWFAPGVFAVAFILSYLGSEGYGPVGAVLGLAAGLGIGWAAGKYVFPVAPKSEDPDL
ncbi:hypothetical protein [Dinoroseobacter sp. S375]|uniref:hypothetical protein n=1 Tax=Dinoroseobacter sp. S375 TaxID=3415136 RepID=UPI003C7C1BB0